MTEVMWKCTDVQTGDSIVLPEAEAFELDKRRYHLEPADVDDPDMIAVKEAIEIILSDTQRYTTSLNYAVNYCLHAKTITTLGEMYTQVLYILNNIQHWRHPSAKDVRTTLKDFVAKYN